MKTMNNRFFDMMSNLFWLPTDMLSYWRDRLWIARLDEETAMLVQRKANEVRLRRAKQARLDAERKRIISERNQFLSRFATLAPLVEQELPPESREEFRQIYLRLCDDKLPSDELGALIDRMQEFLTAHNQRRN